MKQKLLLLRFAVLMSVFLFVLSSADLQAQKNASRKAEKELFGKTGKSKPMNDKAGARGAAAKAMKEQEKKEAQREREDEKNIEKLRKRHIEIQSAATQERMANNGKKTDENYKVKKQKQRKEQDKPDLKQPEQPRPPKDQAKPKVQKPKEPKLQKGKTKVKVQKPKPPKAQKNQAKVKKQDPKKQPKLKQHKVRKYKN
jgi:hypothetical protein